MKYNKHTIVKKYTRGNNKGKRVEMDINIPKNEDIYSFLWDEAISYSRKNCDYIIEWHD